MGRDERRSWGDNGVGVGIEEEEEDGDKGFGEQGTDVSDGVSAG